MFTSEPSLAQRIERLIADTPIVDTHSRIDPGQPGVPDLAALIGDAWVGNGLLASGLPLADLDPTLPADERVRRSIPYLKRMRNTAAAWCLFRIFRDLYDFDEPHLTLENYRALFDRVEAGGRDPAWAGSVLGARSRLRAIVTDQGPASSGASEGPGIFAHRLEAGPLLCPGLAGGRTTPAASWAGGNAVERLEATLGERPTSPGHLERLVFDWLDRTVTDRVRFVSTPLGLNQRFEFPPESQFSHVIERAMGQLTSSSADLPPSPHDLERLASFVLWPVLMWHHERKKSLQLVVGAGSSPPSWSGPALPGSTWRVDMARSFRMAHGAKIDLIVADGGLAREAASLAGELPNVHVSGDWGGNFFPKAIEEGLMQRIQLAPMSKLTGFVSNAASVEWSYGRLQMARKAMALALAGLVEGRYFEEDEVSPLLAQILDETPRQLYGLD